MLPQHWSCPNFPPLPPRYPVLLCFHSQFPHCCPHPWVLHLWLISWPSFNQSPPLSSPLIAVSLFHDSMPLLLFCSLVYFIHLIPLISEILWYLSFTDWLISLSMIVSSSTHANAKGRTSCFLLHSIPVCKCATVLFIHSSTDGHLDCFQHLAL